MNFEMDATSARKTSRLKRGRRDETDEAMLGGNLNPDTCY